MNTELSSKYDPSAVEAQAYQVWLDEKCFHADPARSGEGYCIVIPPPNVTGALHLGHAINNTLQDILTRQHRMAGFNTLWVPGIDHAGIATQAVVEKQLKEQENKTRHDVGREGLVERIWKWKQQYGDRILEQLKRMGCSCDWDHTRFTLDDMCAKAVRETFFKLFKDGLIYRGKRLVNWDTFLQTSISDDEIYHETVKTSLWHIRYPIENSRITGVSPVSSSRDEETHGRDARDTGSLPTHMVVATTRPETMLGDTAVAVHSEDPRWNWAIGKHVRLPLTNRLIPIIADDILVDPKFGTGVVKVTPAHDPNDYAVWSRHKGQPDEIELINILTPDGKISADRPEWSKYAGMKRMDARKAVVKDLEDAGLLEKEEPHEAQVGHSDRSKTPVEPYLSDQWFVKMAPLAEPALEVVRNGTIKFHPERHAQQYLSWLGEKRDWPVSRQLWWGHRIPVWTKRMEIRWKEKDFRENLERISAILENADNGHIWLINAATGTRHSPGEFRGVRPDLDAIYDVQICLRSDGHVDSLEPETWSQLLEQAGFTQDPDVLDTWFSSALWPHSTLGWPEKTPDLAKYYPTNVLLTGRDIITLWVARMVMMGMYNMGQRDGETERQRDGEIAGQKQASAISPSLDPSVSRSPDAKRLGIPFFDVAINPTILDGKGERMSKSKGNGVDPVDIIDSYGADALRFTLTKMATETQDARMPVKRDASGKNTSEKFDEGRNFCNKLWNACRFALANLEAAAKMTAGDFDAVPVGKSSDEDLMQRTQQGDKSAFSLLYERYCAAVLAYLYRILGNVEQVETLGQEVFLRAFRFAATYQYPSKFSTWLFTITRNVAMNPARRQESPIRRIAELNLENIDMTGDPAQVAARATDDPAKREELERVLKALETLPAEQKQVIVLGVFQDLSYAEMEKITGASAQALRSRMFDGLKGLATKVTSAGPVGSALADAGPSIMQDASAEADPTFTLVDRWIVGRFHRTVAECDEALKTYRFDVYAKSCYDFFWRDFCDWYVEAIKPAMKDPARAPQTAEVLAAVLDGSLRLMHPMIPFITETVWWRLNDVRPQRGLPGLLDCPPSKRLVLAAWPKAEKITNEADAIFPKLQEVISSIRTIRNDYQVNPKQTVPVSIKAAADFVAQITDNRELVELLGTCSLKDVRADLSPVAKAVTASVAGCDIYVEGLIDPETEKARLRKELEAKKKSIDGMNNKLGNESYVAKAPPQVVQQTRDQLAAFEAEVVKMEEALRKLG